MKIKWLFTVLGLIFLVGCDGPGPENLGNNAAGTTQPAPVANVLPQAEAGANQIVQSGSGVTLDSSASSDSDGSIAGYSWIQSGGIAVELSSAETDTPKFTAPDIETTEILIFEVTVTDDRGGTATDSIEVTVNPVDPGSTDTVDSDDDESSGNDSGDLTLVVQDGVLTASQDVIASEGAVITLPSGVILDIPENALAQNTTIKISVPENQGPESGIQNFQFQPEELEFLTSVTLTIPYATSESNLQVAAWQFSSLLELQNFGSEIANVEPMEIVSHDSESGILSVRLDHFTFVIALIQVQEYAYIVKHFPPEYINKGSILFTLTDLNLEAKPSWFVGHTALFVDETDVCTIQNSDRVLATPDRIIESTNGSVQVSTLRQLITLDGHIFMGAREPLEQTNLSIGDRNSIVQYLEDQVREGKGYSSIGSGVIDDNSFSCVGLAEAAYESVGRGMVPTLLQVYVLAPIALFLRTREQERIQVRAGELVEFEVHGVVVHPDSPWILTGLRGWYCNTYPCTGEESGLTTDVLLTAEGLPEGATFERSGRLGQYLFSWQTTAADAESTKRIDFSLLTSPTVNDVFGGVELGPITKESRAIIEVVSCPGCGDGNLDGSEQCDDGNITDGDGCSSTCTEEPTSVIGSCTGVEHGAGSSKFKMCVKFKNAKKDAQVSFNLNGEDIGSSPVDSEGEVCHENEIFTFGQYDWFSDLAGLRAEGSLLVDAENVACQL